MMLPRPDHRRIRRAVFLLACAGLIWFSYYLFSGKLGNRPTVILRSSDIPPEYYQDSGLYGPLESMYLTKVVNIDNLNDPIIQAKRLALREFDRALKPPSRKVSLTPDPLQVIAKLYPDSEKYKDIPKPIRAVEYSTKILPRTHYVFAPLSGAPNSDLGDARKIMQPQMKLLTKLHSIVTDEDLDQMGLDGVTLESFVYDQYYQTVDVNQDYLRYVRTALNHLRIFSDLFLKDPESFAWNIDMVNSCETASLKLFPWFTGEYPTFEKYDPETMERTVIHPFAETNEDSGCMVKSVQTAMKGKGVVLTIANQYVSNVMGLLSVIRAQDPDPLPIQLFYKEGELGLDQMKKIMKRATEPVNSLHPGNEVPEGLVKEPKPLDITFVNVKTTVTKEFKERFDGFGNKLLAYFFNTFEEMILMDADTVPLVPLTTFYESSEFKETGTLFYRDRELGTPMLDSEKNFLRDLMNGPQQRAYLDLGLGREDVLEKNRMFTSNAKYLMEAGLVTINRRHHFDAVLTTHYLTMIHQIMAACWGDKELFWLATEYMGNPYAFSAHPSGAAGILRDKPESKLSNTLCSTHPTHFMDDAQSLAWINSGFEYCKRDPQDEDNKWEAVAGLDKEGISKFYHSALKIRDGLIPPRPYDGSLESVPGEPGASWDGAPACQGYMWCANDVVGGKAGLENPEIGRGIVVHFPKELTDKYDYLGQLWVDYRDQYEA